MVGSIENEGESVPRTRTNHPPSLTAKVAVEAIRAHKTTVQIAQMFGAHSTHVGGERSRPFPAGRICLAGAARRGLSRPTRIPPSSQGRWGHRGSALWWKQNPTSWEL